jgi:hypothetical protein
VYNIIHRLGCAPFHTLPHLLKNSLRSYKTLQNSGNSCSLTMPYILGMWPFVSSYLLSLFLCISLPPHSRGTLGNTCLFPPHLLFSTISYSTPSQQVFPTSQASKMHDVLFKNISLVLCRGCCGPVFWMLWPECLCPLKVPMLNLIPKVTVLRVGPLGGYFVMRVALTYGISAFVNKNWEVECGNSHL